MPVDVKRKLYVKQFNAENSNMMRGMFPLLDNDVSHKEFFDMGAPFEEADEMERTKYLVEQTPMPQEPEYAHLSEKYRTHYNFMR